MLIFNCTNGYENRDPGDSWRSNCCDVCKFFLNLIFKLLWRLLIQALSGQGQVEMGVMDDWGVEWGEWVGEIWYLKACFMMIVNSNVFWGDGKVVRGGWREREREVSNATSGFDRGYRLLFRIPLFTYGHSVFLSDLFLLKKEQIDCFDLWCYFNFVLQYIQYKFLKCSTASVSFILKTVLNMQQLGYGEFLNNITIPKSVFK